MQPLQKLISSVMIRYEDCITMRRDLSSKIPLIGILCWERDSMPRGLVQLERLPGNSANPKTFEFPVRYCRIEGANIHTILENPRHNVLQSMIDEAHKMEEQGVRAITTSCGFNAIFQRELTHSLHLPVFTFSLMQMPLETTRLLTILKNWSPMSDLLSM